MKPVRCSASAAHPFSRLAILPLAALLAGCPAPDTGDGNDVAATVHMQGIAFVPQAVTIAQGDTVRWVNDDIVAHTTTSGNPGDAEAGSLWDSGIVRFGQSFEHTFNDVGEFVYFCEVHPAQMRDAKIIVEPAEGGGS